MFQLHRRCSRQDYCSVAASLSQRAAQRRNSPNTRPRSAASETDSARPDLRLSVCVALTMLRLYDGQGNPLCICINLDARCPDSVRGGPRAVSAAADDVASPQLNHSPPAPPHLHHSPPALPLRWSVATDRGRRRRRFQPGSRGTRGCGRGCACGWAWRRRCWWS